MAAVTTSRPGSSHNTTRPLRSSPLAGPALASNESTTHPSSSSELAHSLHSSAFSTSSPSSSTSHATTHSSSNASLSGGMLALFRRRDKDIDVANSHTRPVRPQHTRATSLPLTSWSSHRHDQANQHTFPTSSSSIPAALHRSSPSLTPGPSVTSGAASPSTTWMTDSPFGPPSTPRFSRLALASPNVVLPLSPKEYRRKKRATVTESPAETSRPSSAGHGSSVGHGSSLAHAPPLKKRPSTAEPVSPPDNQISISIISNSTQPLVSTIPTAGKPKGTSISESISTSRTTSTGLLSATTTISVNPSIAGSASTAITLPISLVDAKVTDAHGADVDGKVKLPVPNMTSPFSPPLTSSPQLPVHQKTCKAVNGQAPGDVIVTAHGPAHHLDVTLSSLSPKSSSATFTSCFDFPSSDEEGDESKGGVKNINKMKQMKRRSSSGGAPNDKRASTSGYHAPSPSSNPPSPTTPSRTLNNAPPTTSPPPPPVSSFSQTSPTSPILCPPPTHPPLRPLRSRELQQHRRSSRSASVASLADIVHRLSTGDTFGFAGIPGGFGVREVGIGEKLGLGGEKKEVLGHRRSRSFVGVNMTRETRTGVGPRSRPRSSGGVVSRTSWGVDSVESGIRGGTQCVGENRMSVMSVASGDTEFFDVVEPVEALGDCNGVAEDTNMTADEEGEGNSELVKDEPIAQSEQDHVAVVVENENHDSEEEEEEEEDVRELELESDKWEEQEREIEAQQAGRSTLPEIPELQSEPSETWRPSMDLNPAAFSSHHPEPSLPASLPSTQAMPIEVALASAPSHQPVKQRRKLTKPKPTPSTSKSIASKSAENPCPYAWLGGADAHSSAIARAGAIAAVTPSPASTSTLTNSDAKLFEHADRSKDGFGPITATSTPSRSRTPSMSTTRLPWISRPASPGKKSAQSGGRTPSPSPSTLLGSGTGSGVSGSVGSGGRSDSTIGGGPKEANGLANGDISQTGGSHDKEKRRTRVSFGFGRGEKEMGKKGGKGKNEGGEEKVVVDAHNMNGEMANADVNAKDGKDKKSKRFTFIPAPVFRARRKGASIPEDIRLNEDGIDGSVGGHINGKGRAREDDAEDCGRVRTFDIDTSQVEKPIPVETQAAHDSPADLSTPSQCPQPVRQTSGSKFLEGGRQSGVWNAISDCEGAHVPTLTTSADGSRPSYFTLPTNLPSLDTTPPLPHQHTQSTPTNGTPTPTARTYSESSQLSPSPVALTRMASSYSTSSSRVPPSIASRIHRKPVPRYDGTGSWDAEGDVSRDYSFDVGLPKSTGAAAFAEKRDTIEAVGLVNAPPRRTRSLTNTRRKPRTPSPKASLTPLTLSPVSSYASFSSVQYLSDADTDISTRASIISDTGSVAGLCVYGALAKSLEISRHPTVSPSNARTQSPTNSLTHYPPLARAGDVGPDESKPTPSLVSGENLVLASAFYTRKASTSTCSVPRSKPLALPAEHLRQEQQTGSTSPSHTPRVMFIPAPLPPDTTRAGQHSSKNRETRPAKGAEAFHLNGSSSKAPPTNLRNVWKGFLGRSGTSTENVQGESGGGRKVSL